MVKICPTCKKFVPISATVCPICGNKDLFEMDDEPVLSQTEFSQTTSPVPIKQKKKVSAKTLFIALGIVIVSIIGIVLLIQFANPCRKGHTWENATCTVPKTCKVCGETTGLAAGHSWKDATCTAPKTCKVCGETTGSAVGHSWKDATCTAPKTCKVCGETTGSAAGHTWIDATCTKPKTCSVCLKTSGTKLAHNVQNYICTMCGESVVKQSDVPNILDITSAKYEINSVGGIDQYMTFRNKSSEKTINYIDLDVSFYNAVGDIIRDEIGRGTVATLQYSGPLAPGRSSGEIYWRACFYNATFSGTMRINEIRIRYSDGTRLVLDGNVASNAVVNWR